MLYRRAILTMKRRLKLRIAKFSFKFEKIIVQISKCICQKCICQLLQNVFFQNYKLYLSKLHSVFVKVILSIWRGGQSQVDERSQIMFFSGFFFFLNFAKNRFCKTVLCRIIIPSPQIWSWLMQNPRSTNTNMIGDDLMTLNIWNQSFDASYELWSINWRARSFNF